MSYSTVLSRKRWFVVFAFLAMLLVPPWSSVRPAQAVPNELFFSEYIEGSSNNKALEIYNGTEAAVDLAAGGYNVQMYFNGSASPGLMINLTGTVANGDVYILAQSSANAAILAQADQTNGAGWFNGDDAVVLRKGGVAGPIVDVIGQIGFDPGTQWGTGDTSTADNTLRRKATTCAGDPDGANAFDPVLEWDGFVQDTFDGLGSHTADCGGADTAPAVSSTTPAGGAGDVALDSSITITFNEAVNTSGTWFNITCGASGSHTATPSGGPTVFTLDPDIDFVSNETCTVTLFAAQVTDQDTNDPPDNIEENYVWSFSTVAPPEACGDAFTPIYTIQGSGNASPLDGMVVSTEGVVTGDFQTGAALRGFFIQDTTGDSNPTTSDGIFVFDGNTPAVDVSVGDIVRVRGTVDEFNGLTEITGVELALNCGGGSVAATTASLPVTNLSDFEPLEGMLVTFPQALVISEFFNFGRFGEIVLTTERQFQPTAVEEPGSPEAAQIAQENALSRITLDDGRSSQNPDPAIHPNGEVFDLTNRFRGGDLVQNVTGILDFAFGLYRIQPTEGADYTPANPRPDQPDEVGGNLKVAGSNVLNYFLTLNDGSPHCGPNGDQECRGANNAEEFERQRAKILSALGAIEADIFGLNELENTTGVEPLQDIVNGLNEQFGAGTYDFINTGVIGTDAIKVGLIYKPASVTPIGNYAILDSSVDPRFLDTKNRPALAQSFQDNSTGGIFTVAVNHLKSKGSDCNDVGDPDTGDGAGNCNLTRKAAAEALVDWLDTDPTGSKDPDFLIIGDLNSYDKEDPIDAILEGPDDTLGTGDDYNDLILQKLGEFAYSFVFDGQLGYLDHALANQALLSEVTGATEWHINADEPDILDYDTTFKQDAQDALYEPNAFRSADHDAVIVGLTVCDEIAPALEVTVSPDSLWPPNHKYVPVNATVVVSDNFDPAPDLTLVSVTSNEPDQGQGKGDKPNDIVIIDDFNFQLRAERFGSGSGRIYTVTYQATDACGNSTTATATVTIPHDQGNSSDSAAAPTNTSGTDAGTTAAPTETDTGAAPTGTEGEPTPTDTNTEESEPAETDTTTDESTPEDGSTPEGEPDPSGTDTGAGTEETDNGSGDANGEDDSTTEDESGSSNTGAGEPPEGSDPAETEDTSGESGSEEEPTSEAEPTPSDTGAGEETGESGDAGTEDTSGETGSEETTNPEDSSD